MTCALCHGTKVVVDGGTTFPCFGCGPVNAAMNPVDAVVYGTTYAVVLDRRLQAAWASPLYCNNSALMEDAERAAAKTAIEAAAHAVQRFHDVAKAVEAGWGGTDVAKLYTLAGGHRHEP